MKSKKNKISNIKKTPKPEMPSAVDDAANVMSSYNTYADLDDDCDSCVI